MLIELGSAELQCGEACLTGGCLVELGSAELQCGEACLTDNTLKEGRGYASAK
jgi:hypothetical protein